MKNNEPAFPTTEIAISSVGTEHTQYLPGLTKREYFAAMAMQGLVSSLTASREELRVFIVQTAVVYADTLIKELNKENKNES